ncbi:MAG: MarR family winged helix-turn-helix transcriptional regulator [Caulobacteraceae bacterium]
MAFFAQVAAVERLARARREQALTTALSDAEFALLNALEAGEADLGPKALAEVLQASKAAVTHTLQRLQSRGLIEVSADAADQRRKRLSPTPEGREALRAARAALRPVMDRAREQFAPAEFELATRFLERVRVWLASDF